MEKKERCVREGKDPANLTTHAREGFLKKEIGCTLGERNYRRGRDKRSIGEKIVPHGRKRWKRDGEGSRFRGGGDLVGRGVRRGGARYHASGGKLRRTPISAKNSWTRAGGREKITISFLGEAGKGVGGRVGGEGGRRACSGESSPLEMGAPEGSGEFAGKKNGPSLPNSEKEKQSRLLG